MEKKNNSGALFVNKKKVSDSHPDYTGSIVVNGAEYWFSAWKNSSPTAGTYLKCSVKPKEAFPEPTYQDYKTDKPASTDFDLEDEIPF